MPTPVLRTAKRLQSAQEAREVFGFPPSRASITREGFFAAVKFLGVDATPARSVGFVRDNGMQHLVIKDVLEEPARHERLVEQRMNPNDTIFLLDRAENKILLWTLAPTPTPDHSVTAQSSAEMSFVNLFKNVAQIEIAAFMAKVEMALHG